MNKPTGFRYISEDRRIAMLDRRAEQRGPDRRKVHYPRTISYACHLSEQEIVAERLRADGMWVR